MVSGHCSHFTSGDGRRSDGAIFVVGHLTESNRPVTDVFPVVLLPSFEEVFRIFESDEAVFCLRSVMSAPFTRAEHAMLLDRRKAYLQTQTVADDFALAV